MLPFTDIAPPRPRSRHAASEVRLFAALRAGSIATAAFLGLYYATLGLLPWVFAYPTTEFPVSAWAHRLDLSQFLGSLVYPPYPTPFTWVLGFLLLVGLLVGQAVVYAFLLSWTLQTSDTVKGLGLGLAAGAGFIFNITLANGYHPAIMRNALPDTGAFMLGWSNWAPYQLLLVHVVYGLIIGRLYQPKS